MTSTITGLPDRYRPLDEVGPLETTPTGVIRCWRAKDRVLNRDVAIRVHEPGGPAAREWISRALTAGGLATPALAMVYDAAEGGGGAGGAAYVVNEWIEGQTLADRLAAGPMGEREARTVLRRLAEGIAEAHRVGLAVGGLSPETVVLRPNGLVGLRAVPAATGSMQGDIAALGALLEYCLTGQQAGAPGPDGSPAPVPVIAQPDLAALVRRARSTQPGAGLSSAAAMAALLAAPPRPGASHLVRQPDESESGWLHRLRERRDDDLDDPAAAPDAGGPRLIGPDGLPPVPPRRGSEEDLLPLDAGFGTGDAGDTRLYAHDEHGSGAQAHEEHAAGYDDEPADAAVQPARRRLLVIGLPLLALAVVVALAWWLGTNVLSVAGSVDGPSGSTPPPSSSSAPAEQSDPAGEPPAATIVGGTLYNPQGDGEPENDEDVPLSFDGDPASSWSTVTYFNNPAFGGLKDGVGIVYDLGEDVTLAGVTLTTTTPGATMEVRAGDGPDGALASYALLATADVDGTTELTFDEPVTTRYLLVWVTSLVESADGFSADIAEVGLRPAG